MFCNYTSNVTYSCLVNNTAATMLLGTTILCRNRALNSKDSRGGKGRIDYILEWL
jgi:hypothetical protein